MAKQPRAPVVDRQHVRRLLRQYACPVPYHEVRTRFLGNIASPGLSGSPLQVVKDLWGGELPEFDSLEDLNILIDALINGMWNALTVHQRRTEPFRLVKVPVDPSITNLARLALVRRQEVDGFVDGLFGGSEEIDLPEKANASMSVLAEMRGMMAGAHDLATREVEPEDPARITATFRHLREVTRIMEREIHAVVLDCTRARRQMLSAAALRQPTRH